MTIPIGISKLAFVLLAPVVLPNAPGGGELADTSFTRIEDAVRAQNSVVVTRMLRAQPSLAREAIRRSLTAYLERSEAPELFLAQFVADRYVDAVGDSFYVRVVGRAARMTPAQVVLRRRAADAFRAAQREYAAERALEAIDAYRRTVRLAEEAGDPTLAAEAWNGLGTTHYAIGRYAEADTLYGRALALAEREGDRELSVHLLRNIGIARVERSAFAAADSSFRAAREAALGLRDDVLAARLLNDLGNSSRARGDIETAEARYREAFAEVRRLGMNAVEAPILMNVASAREEQGDAQEAIRVYGDVLDRATAMGDRRIQAAILSRLGRLVAQAGDPPGGIAALARALSIEEGLGETSALPSILAEMGDAYARLGDAERAAELHGRAVVAARAAKDSGREAAALAALATDDFAAGRIDSALAAVTAAHELFRSLDRVDDALAAGVNEGAILLGAGRADDAAGVFSRVAAVAKRTGRANLESWARVGLGAAAAACGEAEEAARELALASELARASGEVAAEVEAGVRAARALAAGGHLDAALAAYRDAIARLDQNDARREGDAERILLWSGTRSAYEEAILLSASEASEASRASGSTAARATAVSVAFEISERAHARAFPDLLARGGALALASFSPALRDEEARLARGRARTRRALAAEWAKPQPDSTVVASIVAARDSIAEAAGALRAAASAENRAAAAALGLAAPQDLAEIQARVVPGDGILLEYFLGRERGVLFVVERGGIRVAPIAAGRQAIADMVRSIRAPFENAGETAGGDASAPEAVRDASASEAARELSALLLGPIRDRLRKNVRVVIVPDGSLWALPFGALPVEAAGAGPRFLVEDAILSFAPSATALAAGADATRARAPETMLAFGNPELRDSAPIPSSFARDATGRKFGALPGGEAEANAVARLFRGETFIAGAATEGRAKREAARYRFLHFATHAVAEAERPLNSGILLAADDSTGDDGFLRVPEILSLPLAADLVALSGCDANLSRRTGADADGVVALSSAILAAGARSVLVTLSAPPRAPSGRESDRTADVVREFYRALRSTGGDAALALARAQRAALAAGAGAGAAAVAGAGAPLILVGASKLPLARPFPLPLAIALATTGLAGAGWAGARFTRRRARSAPQPNRAARTDRATPRKPRGRRR